jgi:cephalosporin hydroxylase
MTIQDAFHKLYYESKVWSKSTRWLGVSVLKSPLDLWIYQEIIYRNKPDLIVECGTFKGGSAFYMACICDLVGTGKILAVDKVLRKRLPTHGRINYFRGNSVSPETIDYVRAAAAKVQNVMVVLDSNHAKDHVLKEIQAYSTIVTRGQYLIVEDGNINGHPVKPNFGPGPAEAIDEFLKTNPDCFEIDRTCEKFWMTFNPGGYLRRR